MSKLLEFDRIRLRAELHRLYRHNCDGNMVMPSNGDVVCKNCKYCDRIVRINNLLMADRLEQSEAWL